MSLFPYHSTLYTVRVAQVAAERAHEFFRRRGATGVRRYELPLVAGLNFVINDVFEGSVNGYLNLDGHGKTNSFRLLTPPVRLPMHYVHHVGQGRTANPSKERR